MKSLLNAIAGFTRLTITFALVGLLSVIYLIGKLNYYRDYKPEYVIFSKDNVTEILYKSVDVVVTDYKVVKSYKIDDKTYIMTTLGKEEVTFSISKNRLEKKSNTNSYNTIGKYYKHEGTFKVQGWL